MSSPIVSPAGYVNNSPANIEYYTNIRLVAGYMPLVAEYQTVSAQEIRDGKPVSDPPPAPLAAHCTVTADGTGVLTTFGPEFAYPQPPKPEPVVIASGTPHIDPKGYVDPFSGRIWAEADDTVPVGQHIQYHGTEYVRGVVQTPWGSKPYYDPA